MCFRGSRSLSRTTTTKRAPSAGGPKNDAALAVSSDGRVGAVAAAPLPSLGGAPATTAVAAPPRFGVVCAAGVRVRAGVHGDCSDRLDITGAAVGACQGGERARFVFLLFDRRAHGGWLRGGRRGADGAVWEWCSGRYRAFPGARTRADVLLWATRHVTRLLVWVQGLDRPPWGARSVDRRTGARTQTGGWQDDGELSMGCKHRRQNTSPVEVFYLPGTTGTCVTKKSRAPSCR